MCAVADAVRANLRELEGEYDQTEEDIKALQSVGQIIGEVLRQLDPERCTCCLLYTSPSPRDS